MQSAADAVEGRVRELLRAYPRMPATVIAERVGWTRSIRTLSGRVAELNRHGFSAASMWAAAPAGGQSSWRYGRFRTRRVDHPDAAMKAPVVEPVNPGQRRELDVDVYLT